MKDRIPPNQSCENCRFWNPDERGRDGVCRAHPGERYFYQSWNWWCGEWRETYAEECERVAESIKRIQASSW